MDDKKNETRLKKSFDNPPQPQQDASSAYLGMMGWPYNVPKNNS